MKKLATLQYDVTDLVTAGKIDYLIEVTKGKDELVKNAHIPSLEEAEDMPDEQFALILYHPHIGKMKKLAMTDKYLTELNMRIFEDKVDSLPESIVKVAAYYLAKAAHFYKLTVPEPIKKYAEDKPISNWVNIAEINPTRVKVASENEKFALGNKYPIHTSQLVKKAMVYFTENWKRFSPLNAFEYAINVKTAADKLGVDYKGTRIEKYAYIQLGTLSKTFRAAVAARKGYVAEEDRPAFDDLIKEAKNLGPVKTAEVLEALDRATGLNREWNKSIEDPIFTVFETTTPRFVKLAAPGTPYNGIEINLESLRKLPDGAVDSETLKDLKSSDGLDVFESLPTPVKVKIAKSLTKVAVGTHELKLETNPVPPVQSAEPAKPKLQGPAAHSDIKEPANHVKKD
jgi:hypothetical protein